MVLSNETGIVKLCFMKYIQIIKNLVFAGFLFSLKDGILLKCIITVASIENGFIAAEL